MPYEIICIDDASPTTSPNPFHEWMKQHPHLRRAAFRSATGHGRRIVCRHCGGARRSDSGHRSPNSRCRRTSSPLDQPAVTSRLRGCPASQDHSSSRERPLGKTAPTVRRKHRAPPRANLLLLCGKPTGRSRLGTATRRIAGPARVGCQARLSGWQHDRGRRVAPAGTGLRSGIFNRLVANRYGRRFEPHLASELRRDGSVVASPAINRADHALAREASPATVVPLHHQHGKPA